MNLAGQVKEKADDRLGKYRKIAAVATRCLPFLFAPYAHKKLDESAQKL